MAEQYTNIRVVLDKITRHPLLQGISLENAVGYTVEFFNIVGVPAFFLDKSYQATVSNYRVALPCDYVSVNLIKGNYGIYRNTSDVFHCMPASTTTTVTSVLDDTIVVRTPEQPTRIDRTFKIQGGYIYFSSETDEIVMSYKAIPVDSDGFPLVPDNSAFLRALTAYIKKEYFTILFDMNRIPQQVLQQALQDYAFAVGACETDMLKLDLSKAESFSNSFRQLMVRTNEFQSGFSTIGSREVLITH